MRHFMFMRSGIRNSSIIVKKGKKYTTDNSDLYVQIEKVFFETDEYYKAKISLRYKYGEYKGYACEEGKKYKLYKDKIGHWYEI